MAKKILICLVLFSASCSVFSAKKENVVIKEVTIQAEENVVPGTVSEFYVEPMIDSVEVPGTIDPKGVYYRPTHREIVEIRPGRFETVEYPEEDKNLRNNR